MGHDVDRPAVGPVLVGRVLVAAATDTGVGEEDVDRAELLLGLGDQPPDVVLARHVAGDREATDVPGHLLEAGDVAVGDDDAPGALLRETPGDRLADAAGRAGDDGDLVQKPVHG